MILSDRNGVTQFSNLPKHRTKKVSQPFDLQVSSFGVFMFMSQHFRPPVMLLFSKLVAVGLSKLTTSANINIWLVVEGTRAVTCEKRIFY